MDFREELDKKKTFNRGIIEAELADCIRRGEYNYDCEFVGSISTGWHEGEDGMYYYVELFGDSEDNVFACHTFKIGEYCFCCHEYEDTTYKWYFNDDKIDDNNVEKSMKAVLELLEMVLKPFNFEQYAIDSFDSDVIAESIPYGNPYYLIIEGRVFLIEQDTDTYDEQKIRDFLKKNNWSEERINNAIKAGYVLTGDVYETVSDLPIVYLNNSDSYNFFGDVE